MRQIKFTAVVIGFVVGFVVPYSLVFAIGPALSWASNQESVTLGTWFTVLWFGVAIAAPIAAGYLAARLAKVRPLLHGAAVGLLGVLAGIALSHSMDSALVSAAVFGAGGVAGGWLSRAGSGGQSAL